MKRILVIAVLAVLLTSTAGATVAMAAPAGNAHVRQFDVKTGPVSGKLTIDPTAQTFVFNGVGGTPGQMYYLSISLNGDETIQLDATAAAADGSIHMKGQCTVTMKQLDDAQTVTGMVAPRVRGDYMHLFGFALYNYGAFFAKLACYYSTDGGVTWHESGHTSAIWSETEGIENFYMLGVPYGALVKIHAIVVAGKDRTGPQVYQYIWTPGNLETYRYEVYSIYGTTLNPTLVWDQYYEWPLGP
jgi:hypothetical protein